MKIELIILLFQSSSLSHKPIDFTSGVIDDFVTIKFLTETKFFTGVRGNRF